MDARFAILADTGAGAVMPEDFADERRWGRIAVSLTLRVLDGSAGVPPALGSARNGQRSGRDARAPMKAPKRGCAFPNWAHLRCVDFTRS